MTPDPGVPPTAAAEGGGMAGGGPCRRWQPIAVTDEDRARRRVVEGLAERFDELPRSLVERVVSEAWSGLDSGRVRDFVPILVTRAASEVLSEARRLQARPVTS